MVFYLETAAKLYRMRRAYFACYPTTFPGLSRTRLITTIKCPASIPSTTMLAAEHCPDLFADFALPRHKLLEIHHSTISLHSAKANYNYPTIRLPYYLSPLAGMSARIYQMVHDGALAFLVVVSSTRKAAKKCAKISENATTDTKSLRLDMAEVAGSNPAEPIVLVTLRLGTT